MELIQAVDERYLWVDAVCIVQDDETHCITQLTLMGAICATAKLTIVASDGDASQGIMGLKGISPPRQIDQRVTSVFETEKFIFRDPVTSQSGASSYFDGGWTYQEFYISQRRLTFEGGQLHWHCSSADWGEDFIPPEDTFVYQPHMDRNLYRALKGQPDFPALNALLHEYNHRQLSFPEDALPGVSGLLSILSRTFDGGFLFGLPDIAFDSALLWHSRSRTENRADSGRTNLFALASRLPSWSWVSWKSEQLCVLEEETFNSSHDRRSWTIPITQWFTHETPDAISKRPIESHWFRLREKFKDCELPEGWTREECDEESQEDFIGPPEGLGQYVYRHAAIEDETFWLPVPIATMGQATERLGPAQTPYISCNTKRGRFAAVQFPTSHFSDSGRRFELHLFNVGLLDGSGNYCGQLFLQGADDILCFPDADSGRTYEVEIVAICRRREVKSSKSLINNWRPKSKNEGDEWDLVPQDVYGVLWVEWVDGIAYRRASGIIGKAEWEGHDLEAVHLVMG